MTRPPNDKNLFKVLMDMTEDKTDDDDKLVHRLLDWYFDKILWAIVIGLTFFTGWGLWHGAKEIIRWFAN